LKIFRIKNPQLGSYLVFLDALKNSMTLAFKFQQQSKKNGFKFITHLSAFVTYSTPRQATYEDEQVHKVHQGLH
jgi:hypothetical protein